MMTGETDSLRIRPMRPEDLDEVERIEQTNFSVPWSRESYAEYLHSKDALLLAAELGGELAGYIGAILTPPEGDITSVSVRRDLQGHRIGTALLDSLIEEVEKRGISCIFLEVRKGNAPAIALYTAAGFVRVGERKNYYIRPREDAWVYRRKQG